MLRAAKAHSMIPTSTPSPTSILTTVNSSGDYKCRTQNIPSSPNITYHSHKLFENLNECHRPDSSEQSNANKPFFKSAMTFDDQKIERHNNIPFIKITAGESNNELTENIIKEDKL